MRSTNARSSALVRPSRFVLRELGSRLAAVMSGTGMASARPRAQVRGGEEVGDLALRVLGAVGAVHDVLLDARREVSADRALVGLLRVGGAHQLAIAGDRVLAFQDLDHDGAGDHVAHQILEERTLAMDGIEAFGLRLGELQHADTDDLQAGLFETAIHLANQVLLYTVGLDYGKRAFERHGVLGSRLNSANEINILKGIVQVAHSHSFAPSRRGRFARAQSTRRGAAQQQKNQLERGLIAPQSD